MKTSQSPIESLFSLLLLLKNFFFSCPFKNVPICLGALRQMFRLYAYFLMLDQIGITEDARNSDFMYTQGSYRNVLKGPYYSHFQVHIWTL